jgi:serine/threonine protein kinase
MSKYNKTATKNMAPAPKPLVDEYGNVHYLSDELARGGQGVVFRTLDVDLAVKQPLDASGTPDKTANLHHRFQNIRILPLPPRIQISLPLAILRDEPGYVMRLLNGMKPFSAFELNGKSKEELRNALTASEYELPKWLTTKPINDFALQLEHYANTGSTRRRLSALSKCASILARLHSAGLVYGDISPNNAFVGEGDSQEVWLIDADNLRLERNSGGNAAYTPQYGAPEIVQARDQSRPRTDCWSFAVMAFRTLALCHPFIGKKVLEPENDNGGWDAESPTDGAPADLDEQAYAGYLPFIDDENDDTNAADSGLPRELVTTPGLRRLFQETFGVGRTLPHRRPSMHFWAIELARALDQSLPCPECKMSYFADNYKQCPYCDTLRPAFARAKTPRWELLISKDATEFALPHRLFNPFSPEYNDDSEFEAVLNFDTKTVIPVRGTRPFPDDLTLDFIEAEK